MSQMAWIGGVYPQYSPSEYVDALDGGLLRAAPFSRGYVWSIEEASEFVESMYCDKHNNDIVVYEIDWASKDMMVVDGLQQLFTMYLYHKNRFPKNDAGRKLLMDSLGTKELKHVVMLDDFFEDFNLSLDPTRPLPTAEFGGLSGYNKHYIHDFDVTKVTPRMKTDMYGGTEYDLHLCSCSVGEDETIQLTNLYRHLNHNRRA